MNKPPYITENAILGYTSERYLASMAANATIQ